MALGHEFRRVVTLLTREEIDGPSTLRECPQTKPKSAR